jgi:hypothetical protein
LDDAGALFGARMIEDGFIFGFDDFTLLAGGWWSHW